MGQGESIITVCKLPRRISPAAVLTSSCLVSLFPCNPTLAARGGQGGSRLKDSVMSFYTDDSPGIKIAPVSLSTL